MRPDPRAGCGGGREGPTPPRNPGGLGRPKAPEVNPEGAGSSLAMGQKWPGKLRERPRRVWAPRLPLQAELCQGTCTPPSFPSEFPTPGQPPPREDPEKFKFGAERARLGLLPAKAEAAAPPEAGWLCDLRGHRRPGAWPLRLSARQTRGRLEPGDPYRHPRLPAPSSSSGEVDRFSVAAWKSVPRETTCTRVVER